MITFTKVETMPKRHGNNHLQKFIEEFVKNEAKIAKINYAPGDYKTPSVCRSVLATTVTRSGYRSIKVIKRGDEVYLVKTE